MNPLSSYGKVRYFKTQPAISERELLDLCERIEEASDPQVDGVVLSSLVKLIYYCALKKNEVISLKIGDVKEKQGGIVREIRLGGDKIPLANHLKALIHDHLQHLNNNGYKTSLSSPLFPRKRWMKIRRGSSARDQGGYHWRKLLRDLRKLSEDFWRKNILEKIRQAGICDYYEGQASKGITARECIEKTAAFARRSIRHTEGILTGRIQPAGRKGTPYKRCHGRMTKSPSKKFIDGEELTGYKKDGLFSIEDALEDLLATEKGELGED